jgi:indole-3-glycerol phosphate synthase
MLAREARDVGLEALVEVRDERELDQALAAGVAIIGVNARDLETLAVDPAVIDRLVPTIPVEVIAVAESGVRDVADVTRYAASGADAVLVGSILSGAPDPAAAVASLAGVARRGRGA